MKYSEMHTVATSPGSVCTTVTTDLRAASDTKQGEGLDGGHGHEEQAAAELLDEEEGGRGGEHVGDGVSRGEEAHG